MFLVHATRLLALLTFRYFLVAGTAYYVWWIRRAESARPRKLQPGTPERAVLRMELKYSLLSSFLFALIGAWIYVAWEKGQTAIYTDFSRHGWAYTISSLPLLFLLHDFYFYVTHRLMHHPALFRSMHRIHHLSRNPTPWTAFSFHPWEALVEAAIFPLLIFYVPVHLGVLLLFLSASTVISVVNHLGYELYPQGFATHPIGRWIVSATHHDQHHRDVRSNFGLYFTIWDRCFSTEHAGYAAAYEAVHARVRASLPAESNRRRARGGTRPYSPTTVSRA